MALHASKHRSYTQSILDTTFTHQQFAAQKAQDSLISSRAVVIAAEMQSGKSGVALALSCLQRLSLSDEDICDRKQLKDTLYLVTMADTALLAQAKMDLKNAPNVVVSNFTHFRQALATDFKLHPPKLIIIDECHYGSSNEGIRYSKVFDYLEQENLIAKIAFISATPFSALYAAGSDSILRDSFHTRLVFHRASEDYHGIRQMHHSHQVIKLDRDQRNFSDDSLMRRHFLEHLEQHAEAGWALIRVPSNGAQQAKQVLKKSGYSDDQVFIIGQKLSDTDVSELTSIDDFKKEYEAAKLFDEKIIAITVAGFRAGINFGQAMKEDLIATWDSTIANIAAVVQANIGRACGYHHNTLAKHYTNLDAVSAYSELLNHLESSDRSDDFESLKTLFEKICERYDVSGFDRGITIRPEKVAEVSRKLDDSKTYQTAGFLAVPALLNEQSPDFSVYTTDTELQKAIGYIRQEYLKEGSPYPKPRRALRGEEQNWIKAQWVNGVTYDDYSNSMSSAKYRTLQFIQQLNDGEHVEFNRIVNPGGGETTEDKRLMATIFSIYNVSGQVDQFKRSMELKDVHEMCDALDCEHDDTVIVLFQRGQHDQAATEAKLAIDSTRIKHRSVFGD